MVVLVINLHVSWDKEVLKIVNLYERSLASVSRRNSFSVNEFGLAVPRISYPFDLNARLYNVFHQKRNISLPLLS